VIEHYDHGIQDSPLLHFILRESNNGPPIRLNMSEADKDALEAFLHVLTDAEFLQDPKFSDPFP
jgi:cytochrome c peroxidase